MEISEALAAAVSQLEGCGIGSPRVDAELLLSHVLGASRVELYAGGDRLLSEEENAVFGALISRRGEGTPLQYITGETVFRGLRLQVRPGVFIPRPETEVVVEKALEVLPSGAAVVLDLGTGCGNIAVSMAVERPRARVVATDIDPLAVELCGSNARLHDVDSRVAARRRDLYGAVEGSPERFDMVVSNPPYVPEDRFQMLAPEVRCHEPPGALLGGPDGLETIRRIVDGAPGFLKAGGWLVLEVDETHAGEVAEGLLSGWTECDRFDDLAGRPRVVRARKTRSF